MIHSYVEAQVARTPEAVAAVLADRSITYAQLNIRANQLSRRLIREGVGRDQIVGISLDRSIEMVIALLAVLKAGGAYIWLDPDYPRERLAFVIDDAQPVIIITESSILERLPLESGTSSLCLDQEASSLSEENPENPALQGKPEDLAYVIYTSGSTGRPKGVAMGHQALSNLLDWQLQSWTMPAAARTLQFTSLNFDVSFQEIFSTIASGGTLVLTTEEMRRDPSVLLRLISHQGVERIFLPFVALQQLAKAFEAEQIVPSSLRDVITAGEQLQITPQIRSLFEHLENCTLHNQYGPAESHIIVTAFSLRGQPDSWPLLPPIGKAIAKARMYILDEDLKPMPEGKTGEIYIGGPALARGYLNRKELTAERFVRDPFSSDEQARLYRTGDLGHLLPSGDIQYLGRADQQVKIRGVRVELGEVEAVMSQHPAVLQAVVCAKEMSVGDKRLVAYLVPKTSPPPDRGEVRAFLESKLPSQFIPSSFVFRTAIPLTPSGKVDRLALMSLPEETAPTMSHQETSEPKGPTNDLQVQLVQIWEEALGKRPIGIDDNFFDLGGHSLVAVEISAKIKERLHKKATTALVFKAPTIAALAEILSTGLDANQNAAVQEFQPCGSKPPFFCAPGFVDLARNLGPDQPFYGLNIDLQQQIPSAETGVQQWAERCVKEIREVQPHGPYFLGGSSGAAALALEVAHQLQSGGERIGLLAFFDPLPPRNTNPHRLRFRLGGYLFKLRYLLGLPRDEQMEYLSTGIHNLMTDLSWRLRILWNPVARRVRQMDVSYHPPAGFKAPTVVFLPRDSYLRDRPDQDPRLNWRQLVGGNFKVHEVPGRHATYMRDPHVKVVADLLVEYLRPASEVVTRSYIGALQLLVLLPSSWIIFLTGSLNSFQPQI